MRNISFALTTLQTFAQVKTVTRRMAYFAETTLRWAIEDTVSWKRPEEDLQDEVFLLKREAAEKRTVN